MAQGPVDVGIYDTILLNIQYNWNGAPETFRKWYKDEVSVFIAQFRPPEDASHDEIDGWVWMRETQYEQAQNAFNMWNEYIAIDLVFQDQPENADITFGYSTTTEDDGSYCSPTLGSLVSNDIYEHYEIENQYIWMSADGWLTLTPEEIGKVGGPGYQTYLHEIGHALGLSHTGPYDASDLETPDYSEDAVFAQDTGQYSIMSYFGRNYEVGVGWQPPDDDTPFNPTGNLVRWQTPTVYDIAAVQLKYGADTTTRTGDTVYGYNYNGPAEWAHIYDFRKNIHPLLVIYDSAGIDTIDLSDYAGGQVLDLRSGAHSDVKGMVGNLGIAYTAVIENGIGGLGDDTIRGNDSANKLSGLDGNDTINGDAGDDTIDGGIGNDTLFGSQGIDSIAGGEGVDFIDGGGTTFQVGTETLTGGLGQDTFVYSRAYGVTVITDFNIDLGEIIDLSKHVIHNFVDLMAIASQVGSDIVLNFGRFSPAVSDTLTLLGLGLDNLDAGNFTFSESDVSAPGDFLAIPNVGFPNATYYSTGAALADGFMVVETSITTYNGAQALMAHRFDVNGVETGTFQVNTTSFGNSPIAARALTLANGNVAVIWTSNDTGGGGEFCFRGRVFDTNGVPLAGTDFVVNEEPPTPSNGPGWGPTMDILDFFNSPSGNGFVVRWRKDIDVRPGELDIHYMQRAFDNNGDPLTDDIDMGRLGDPDVPGFPFNGDLREIVLTGGKVLHWWTGTVPGDASGTLKVMARFSGDEAYVVVGDNNLNQLVSADELPNGNIVFNWSQGNRPQSSTYMSGTQVLILDDDLKGFVRPGTDGGETLTGGIYNDELYGRGGDDVLVGGRGDDLLHGGDGIDTVDYSASVDGVRITLGNLLAQEGGHAQGDRLVSIEAVIGSGAGDEIFDRDIGNNNIFGNYGRDKIYAGAGTNTIDGGRGADVVYFMKEASEYSFVYDAVTKAITVIALSSDDRNGTNAIVNVEDFRFLDSSYSLQELIDLSGYEEDHPVTAENDSYDAVAGALLTVSAANGLLANDDIPDGGGKVLGVYHDGNLVMSVDDPFYGTFTVAQDGSFTFIAGSAGIYGFNYVVEDEDGSTSEANLGIMVGYPPPDAVDDHYRLGVGASLTVAAGEGLLANDDAMGGTASVMGLVDGDELVYTLDGDGGTLSVSSDGSFVFTPDPGFNGEVSFDYSIMALSSVDDVATVTFNVTTGNLPPQGSDKVIAVKEDKAYSFKAADFGFFDSEDDFAAILFNGKIGDGKLTFNGSAIENGARIDVADLGKLVWTPGLNQHGEALGGISFQVVDNGGTDGDGEDKDPSPNTILFDVSEVTDIFKGKKGKDKLVGTEDGDILDGKQGNDKLSGKYGPDVFVFKTGYDRDAILDFETSGSDHDIIDISGLSSVSSFRDLKKNHIEVHGNDVWINGGKGDVLVVEDISKGSLTQDLFVI